MQKAVRLLITTAALSLSFSNAGMAAEEAPKPIKSLSSISLTPSIGAFVFGGSNALNPAATYGLKFNYDTMGTTIVDSLGVELGFNYFSTTTSSGPKSNVDGYVARLDAIYPIPLQKKYIPFLAAGLGDMYLDRGYSTSNAFLIEYGFGIKYYYREWLAVRADARHLLAYKNVDTRNTFEFSTGLTYIFGKDHNKKPVPPAPVVKPAAVPAPEAAPAAPTPAIDLSTLDKLGIGGPAIVGVSPALPIFETAPAPPPAPFAVPNTGAVLQLAQPILEPERKVVAPPAQQPERQPVKEPQPVAKQAETPPPAPVQPPAPEVKPRPVPAPQAAPAEVKPEPVPAPQAAPAEVKPEPVPAPQAAPAEVKPEPVPAPQATPAEPPVVEQLPQPAPEQPAQPLPKIIYQVTIEFDFDKSEIRPMYYEELAALAEKIRSVPGTSVSIEGHTDSIGGKSYNDRLSARRAKRLKEFLVRYGVPAKKISTKGYGYFKPAAENATDEGRQRNRRATALAIVLQGNQQLPTDVKPVKPKKTAKIKKGTKTKNPTNIRRKK